MGSRDIRWPETVTEDRYSEKTSNNLEEVLRFRENCNGRSKGKKKSLGSVLHREKRSSPEIRPGRTLLDIIQSDTTGESRKTWRYFRDKLRLKRAGAAWNSSVRIPVSEIDKMQRSSSISTSNSMNSRTMLRHPSTKIPTSDPDIDSPSGRNRSGRFHRNISGLSDEENLDNNKTEETEATTPAAGDEEEEEGGGGDGGGGAATMSLMALLAETDREMGVEGSAYMMGDGEEEEDEEEEDGGNLEEGEYNSCCVCMVRHKGTASTPCKHTFCRLCSKELSVQRGNCPLCNGYVMEILNIF